MHIDALCQLLEGFFFFFFPPFFRRKKKGFFFFLNLFNHSSIIKFWSTYISVGANNIFEPKWVYKVNFLVTILWLPGTWGEIWIFYIDDLVSNSTKNYIYYWTIKLHYNLILQIFLLTLVISKLAKLLVVLFTSKILRW